MSEQTDEQARSIGKRANELNATIRYTMWSVFKLARPLADDQRAAAADELHRIVDLMRELRASTARRHVREEVPFYTGVRKSIAEIVADLA